MTHDLWATLNEKMQEYLSSVTLADLVAHQAGKPVSVIKDFRGSEKEKVAA
jgi:Rrf2 family transcriptional regulator, iron-sulfur cluster assembly transcription factor